MIDSTDLNLKTRGISPNQNTTRGVSPNQGSTDNSPTPLKFDLYKLDEAPYETKVKKPSVTV